MLNNVILYQNRSFKKAGRNPKENLLLQSIYCKPAANFFPTLRWCIFVSIVCFNKKKNIPPPSDVLKNQ